MAKKAFTFKPTQDDRLAMEAIQKFYNCQSGAAAVRLALNQLCERIPLEQRPPFMQEAARIAQTKATRESATDFYG